MDQSGREIRISIERIVPGGDGLGRHDGLAVFVPRSAPGDELVVRVVDVKPGYCRAEIIEVASPGPGRVEPLCACYGECGGCNLMHLSYEAQLEAKQGMLREAWRRSGGFTGTDDDAVFGAQGIGIEASPPFAYRNRSQFHFDTGHRAGFSRRSSHTILPLQSCPILVPALQHWLSVKGAGSGWEEVSPFLKGSDRCIAFGYGDQVWLDGPDGEVTVEVGGRRFDFHVGGFFQSNLAMLGKLVPVACSGIGGERAADLYCGVGVFGSFLKDAFQKLVCVERDRRAMGFAGTNIGTDAAYAASSVEDWTRTRQAAGHFDYVLMDPPRTGLAATVRDWLARAKPEVIGYVSCDPVTAARDAGFLVKAGYSIAATTIFDFYPQTSNIETYVRFSLD